MPSLFPVMDPYVEEDSIWPAMHLRLISNSSEALQSQVRPKYIVRIEERIALETLSKRYVPDVMMIKTTQVSSGTESNAGLLVADEPQTIRSGDAERRIPYLEVILRQSGNVVTVIEVLSPSNKLGLGRADYLKDDSGRRVGSSGTLRNSQTRGKVSGHYWLQTNRRRSGAEMRSVAYPISKSISSLILRQSGNVVTVIEVLSPSNKSDNATMTNWACRGGQIICRSRRTY